MILSSQCACDVSVVCSLEVKSNDAKVKQMINCSESMVALNTSSRHENRVASSYELPSHTPPRTAAFKKMNAVAQTRENAAWQFKGQTN